MCHEKFFWSAVLIYGILNIGSQAAFLRCYRGSLDNVTVTSLDQPLVLIKSSCIDLSRPTVFYTFGYQGKVAGPATTAVLKAYLGKQKRNVVLLDWEKEANITSWGISISYALYAVPNAKVIGEEFGKSLLRLARAGLNMTDVHLMGHSLGAHLMANAGRRTRALGHIVARVTGLDPARALFEGTFVLQNGIDRKCASFVDIIHTDPGNYGTKESSGTVDIWPNYHPDGGKQDGCPEGDFEQFSKNDLCSHDRSWMYFVESIHSPTAFPSAFALNYDRWVAAAGNTKVTIYLGDLVNPKERGNFYLSTNPSSPYGKGQLGLSPSSSQTRTRRQSALSRILSLFR